VTWMPQSHDLSLGPITEDLDSVPVRINLPPAILSNLPCRICTSAKLTHVFSTQPHLSSQER
jgi:hypothetical protein